MRTYRHLWEDADNVEDDCVEVPAAQASKQARLDEIFNKYVEANECSVCMEANEDMKMEYLSCLHSFCTVCVQKLRTRVGSTCPNCRVPITNTRPDARAMAALEMIKAARDVMRE